MEVQRVALFKFWDGVLPPSRAERSKYGGRYPTKGGSHKITEGSQWKPERVVGQGKLATVPKSAPPLQNAAWREREAVGTFWFDWCRFFTSKAFALR
jgi:hypothetical protein